MSLLLVAEATRDLPLAETTIETPLESSTVRRLAARVVAVPVLRAGLGMLDALLELVPQAQVGYFGLERDETTALARPYYEKVPKDLASASVFLLDPMLATGGSAAMAIDGLAEFGARRVRLLSIVAAPEGLRPPQGDGPERRRLHCGDRPRAQRPEVHPAGISSGQVEFSETIFQEASGAQAEPLAPASRAWA